jgi:hypothetical protein
MSEQTCGGVENLVHLERFRYEFQSNWVMHCGRIATTRQIQAYCGIH